MDPLDVVYLYNKQHIRWRNEAHFREMFKLIQLYLPVTVTDANQKKLYTIAKLQTSTDGNDDIGRLNLETSEKHVMLTAYPLSLNPYEQRDTFRCMNCYPPLQQLCCQPKLAHVIEEVKRQRHRIIGEFLLMVACEIYFLNHILWEPQLFSESHALFTS